VLCALPPGGVVQLVVRQAERMSSIPPVEPVPSAPREQTQTFFALCY